MLSIFSCKATLGISYVCGWVPFSKIYQYLRKMSKSGENLKQILGKKQANRSNISWSTQRCNKSVFWYLGYRTFLEENPVIFKQLLLITEHLA